MTRMPAWLVTLLVGLLLLVGGFGWWWQLRPAPEPQTSSLAALPSTMGEWRGQDIPLEQTVESMLRASFNVQRVYVHRLGAPVWLYVGYYSTKRGGTPEHTPYTCYTAQGWNVEDGRAIEVDTERGLYANEYVVEQRGDRRLVHFWYRSHRSASILTTFGLQWDHVLGRLTNGRGDGALIRLSTPAPPGDEVVARSRLRAFARLLHPLLDAHWPGEGPLRKPRGAIGFASPAR